MKIEKLPVKYQPIWKRAEKILKTGRYGDDVHGAETTKLVLNYKGKIKFDLDVLIPVAMMHDIGHAAILPEHFMYVTGPKKVANGKLVHMLTGAKIALDILKSVKYNAKKTREIVNIISTHDWDQLKVENWKEVYNTTNKRFFHDMDALDRYTETRIKSMAKLYPDRKKLLKILEEMMELFFFDEFKQIARENFKNLS